MVPINVSAIDSYLEAMWGLGGTDLHLTAGAPPLVRVDGRLFPIPDLAPLRAEETAQLILGVLTDELSSQFRREKEVDFSFSWHGQTRFRANVYYQQGTMAMALRAIPYRIPTMEELGLPPIMEHFAHLPQGLILVTGPTGSGKSTTQASVIDFINQNRGCHILTIEDPIEYVHSHKRSAVNQREVGYDTDSFSRALRSALREDPDVILVGEMRDPETIQFALTIAETGHLVFATLHTNDASSALNRIVDVFPSERQQQIRVQLAASLAGVVAQRLVPRVGGGLVAAFEIVIANHPVRNLVREGKSHQIRNVMATSLREGMQTMEVSLNSLVQQGLVSYEDAVERSMFPNEIRPPAMTATAGRTA
jgi:twitching motility protein PilT